METRQRVVWRRHRRHCRCRRHRRRRRRRRRSRCSCGRRCRRRRRICRRRHGFTLAKDNERDDLEDVDVGDDDLQAGHDRVVHRQVLFRQWNGRGVSCSLLKK